MGVETSLPRGPSICTNPRKITVPFTQGPRGSHLYWQRERLFGETCALPGESLLKRGWSSQTVRSSVSASPSLQVRNRGGERVMEFTSQGCCLSRNDGWLSAQAGERLSEQFLLWGLSLPHPSWSLCKPSARSARECDSGPITSVSHLRPSLWLS